MSVVLTLHIKVYCSCRYITESLYIVKESLSRLISYEYELVNESKAMERLNSISVHDKRNVLEMVSMK